MVVFKNTFTYFIFCTNYTIIKNYVLSFLTIFSTLAFQLSVTLKTGKGFLTLCG